MANSWVITNDANATKASSEEKKQTPAESAKKWAIQGDAYWGASDVTDKLDAGLYNCSVSQQVGPILTKIVCDTDNLISFTDSPSLEVLEEIKKFWELKDDFDKHGFLHKRGVLLTGPPGSGKTATIQQLIQLVINEYGGIAMYADAPKVASACVQLTRRIEPDRPIIMIFEDFDALIEQYGENEYLALFDGESQVKNIVFLATSNYPEHLDKRFVDRPSRFDLIKQIDMPGERVRAEYLKNKVPELTEAEISNWVDASEGYSFAHIRELIILVKCYRYDLPDAKYRLDGMRNNKPKSADFDDGIKSKFGFK